MFTSSVGTALGAANVRRMFRKTVSATGLDPDEWMPRELRHSFVSILSDSGVSLEEIADLVGHPGTTVTEKVYGTSYGQFCSRTGYTAMNYRSHSGRGRGRS